MRIVNSVQNHQSKPLAAVILAALLLSLTLFPVNLHPLNASDDAARWAEVKLPAEGISGGWVLADGSDIQYLAAAPDGTLYAVCQGLTYTLYRSEDNGASWSSVGKVKDDIASVAVSPADSAAVYYTTSSTVYRSTDGGNTFQPLPPCPGSGSTDNVEITALDVAWANRNIIAVGTSDRDSSEFGGVYIWDEANMSFVWTDTEIGSYDVYALAFSPGYASDGHLIAVTTDEIDTFTSIKPGDGGWGTLTGNATLLRDNALPPAPVTPVISAAIAIPGNYGSDFYLGKCAYYIAVNTGTGNGDVYEISYIPGPDYLTATDLNVGLGYGRDNTDITSLAASGYYPAVNVLAGAADNAQTYYSTDGGTSWIESRKKPTGVSGTRVLLPPYNPGTTYAATSGADSALSISRDGGHTWNQVSLIDNTISTVVDMAPSPRYPQDNTIFMITFGKGHSLWRSWNGGNIWERLLSGSLESVDTMTRVGLPPQYGDNTATVFVAGESDGQPSIWESLDDGQSYRCRPTKSPGTGIDFPIDTWAIVDESTLFIGSYDGSSGRIYQTINSGFFYFEGAAAGSQPINSLALSPGFEKDGNILTGNSYGWVYWSDDGVGSFQPLPLDATSPPLTGNITVAFDPGFENNRTVYAASDTAGSGIYRFIIGTSTDWVTIDGTLPAGAALNQLRATDYGAIYAVNSDASGGMERCLEPTSPASPQFETVTGGLADSATLNGLWQSGHRLWSVDTTNIKVVTFNDTLTVPVVPVSPDDDDAGIGNLVENMIENVSLDWETLAGATGYEWQCDSDTDLSSVPDGFRGITQASSVVLPPLEPATTYYWRVRASSLVTSPWSEKRSFTTALNPVANKLKLESPAAGSRDVPREPLFQWTGIVGVGAYELMVAVNPDFSDPVITREADSALPANAWQSDVSLDFATTYYWKVRAVDGSTRSAWSPTGSFTTELDLSNTTTGQVAEVTTPDTDEMMLPPTVFLTQPQQSANPSNSPPAAPSPALPDWALYLIAAQAAVIALALVIILVLVLIKRRP
jgi:photosystem II stability/assembly factor-like uncharacterized protein